MSRPKDRKYKGRIIRPRGTAWQVDFGTKNGKRVQRSFETQADAKQSIDEYADQKSLEQVDQKNRRVALYDLTDAQRMDVLTAFDKLSGHASLTDAAEFFMSHTAPGGGTRTVSEVLEEYLDTKKRANRRASTLSDIKMRIGRFADRFGDSPVHTVTTHDLETWLNDMGYTQISRLNYRTAFTGFFNFAKKKKYVKENPAGDIERPIVDERTTEILTVRECGKLMRTVDHECPAMVPYFALCVFAGIRPTETRGLDWRHIDLTKKIITVRPEVAKKRRQRLVDISANLAEWLAPHRRDSGQIHFARNSFDEVRRLAGVPWVHDILRHSFGSYHLAAHEDAMKTAMQMGHMQMGILYNHYRELVTREEANEFWSIRPPAKSNIIQMTA